MNFFHKLLIFLFRTYISYQVENERRNSHWQKLAENGKVVVARPGVNVIKLFSFVTDDEAQ
jgi:hypothetical protein